MNTIQKILVVGCVAFTILHFIPIFWPLLAALWGLAGTLALGYVLSNVIFKPKPKVNAVPSEPKKVNAR